VSGGGNRAVARGDRPRGDRTVIGEATPRTHPPLGGGGWGGRGWDTGYWWSRPSYYWGYGGFGLGYFYYDPFWWGPGYGYGYDPYGYYGGYGQGYGYGGSYRYGEAIGQLRFKVKPREAEVYIDGYFSGTVDDYDGTFQRLDLTEGPHHVELKLAGYAALTFEVNILPNETVTYRGHLEPRP
jgi:hypothetical protein